MNSLTREAAFEFCGLCNQAYYCWQFQRGVLQNPRKTELKGTAAYAALLRVNGVLQEYCVLQIAKLHDPKKHGKDWNLGLDYIIRQGNWSTSVRDRLESLRKKLDALGKDVLNAPRNKVLCHNDLSSILAALPLGAFPAGEDDKYFAALQEFVNLVWQTVRGRDYPFDELGAHEGGCLVSAIGPVNGLPLARPGIPRRP